MDLHSRNERINSVEWLRGIAALGICQMHAFCALDFFSKDEVFFQTYIFPISIAGRLGVAVFFVISGFIIPYSMWRRNFTIRDFFSFLLKRLKRLEPPYLVAILLTLFIAFITTSIKVGKTYEIDWFNLILHFGYLNVFFDNVWVNPVFWTLAIEFQFYILIALLFPLLLKNNITILLLSLGSAMISQYFPMPHFILLHFQLFILGILCFKKYINQISPTAFWLHVTLNAALVYHFHAKAYMVASLATVFIILLRLQLNFKPMIYLGKISYSLYLIHWIVGIELIRNLYLFYNPNSDETTKILLALFIVIISLILSILFYKLIEKPSIKWAKGTANSEH